MQLYLYFFSWRNNFIQFWWEFSDFNNLRYKLTKFYRQNLVNRFCKIFMFDNTSKWLSHLMYFSLKSNMWFLHSKFNFNFWQNPNSKRRQYSGDPLSISFSSFAIFFFKSFRRRQHNNCINKLTNPTRAQQSFNKLQWFSKYFLHPLGLFYHINRLPDKPIQSCWCFTDYSCIDLHKRSLNNEYIKLGIA